MKLLTTLIFLIFLFPSVGTCSNKPSPPPELLQIMDCLENVETHFKKEEWLDSVDDLEMADSLLDEILPNLTKNTNYVILSTFRENIFFLREQLLNHHHENVEDAYIGLSMAYFILNDFYNTSPPLFLLTIGNSIQESKDALQEENYRHLSYEMDEVSKFIQSYGAVLYAHGISLGIIEKFTKIAASIKKTSALNGPEKVEEEMKMLEALYTFIVSKY